MRVRIRRLLAGAWLCWGCAAAAELEVNAHVDYGPDVRCETPVGAGALVRAVEVRSNVDLRVLLGWPNEGYFIMWPNGHDWRFFPNPIAVRIELRLDATPEGRAYLERLNGAGAPGEGLLLEPEVARTRTTAVRLEANREPGWSVTVGYGLIAGEEPVHLEFRRREGAESIQGSLFLMGPGAPVRTPLNCRSLRAGG